VFEAHAIRRLPLVTGEGLVGMITADDLIVDLAGDLGRLARPITGQVLFGHAEPPTPAVPA
jgi:CBS domain-containing protein